MTLKCPVCNTDIAPKTTGDFYFMCTNPKCGFCLSFNITGFGEPKISYDIRFVPIVLKYCKCCKQQIHSEYPTDKKVKRFIISALKEYLDSISGNERYYAESYITLIEKELKKGEKVEK